MKYCSRKPSTHKTGGVVGFEEHFRVKVTALLDLAVISRGRGRWGCRQLWSLNSPLGAKASRFRAGLRHTCPWPVPLPAPTGPYGRPDAGQDAGLTGVNLPPIGIVCQISLRAGAGGCAPPLCEDRYGVTIVFILAPTVVGTQTWNTTPLVV